MVSSIRTCGAGQELALPLHFDAGSDLVTEEQMAERIPCGPDPEHHLGALRRYADAGYDEIFIAQFGEDPDGILSFFDREPSPKL